MREGKPYAKLLLHAVQLVVLFSLIQAVNSHIWYTGVVDVEYTDGLPENSGMEVELEVDQDSADVSIHIDGFITFMQWQNTRNDTTIPAESSEEKSEFDSSELKPLSELQEEIPIMAKIAFSLGILLAGLAIFQIKYSWIIGMILSGFVLWICINLVVFAPLGYVGGMDFGTGAFEDDDRESTVHSTTDSSPVFDLFNGELEVEFTTESYDLGLVNQSELDSVVEKAPGKEHYSFMALDGVAGIHYSPFVVELVWAWLVLFFLAPTVVNFVSRVSIDKPQLL
ncbi:MAG: hypothetical protein VXY11_00270 [Candidatus Thermoplasmatota archaeon]|nr:hypothetical protein [Candidatus Thermoplasmatota archaeon]MEC8788961.1 hypothetical protein [Candidatus Thermoplasmatota archaeon]|tara:strand:+ start:3395 stop:4240 length:846 start_codon:yes stop_codon:yes gene_type:complete